MLTSNEAAKLSENVNGVDATYESQRICDNLMDNPDFLNDCDHVLDAYTTKQLKESITKWHNGMITGGIVSDLFDYYMVRRKKFMSGVPRWLTPSEDVPSNYYLKVEGDLGRVMLDYIKNDKYIWCKRTTLGTCLVNRVLAEELKDALEKHWHEKLVQAGYKFNDNTMYW